MEQKLAEYRARKRKSELIEKAKQSLEKIPFWSRRNMKNETDVVEIPEKSVQDLPEVIKKPIDLVDESESELELEEENLQCCPSATYLDYCLYVLYFAFWATLYVIFIKFGFGIVYFLSSALIGICLNTRTTPKQKGEVSAYSVFNKDCQPIEGSLTAAQFEREIGYKI